MNKSVHTPVHLFSQHKNILTSLILELKQHQDTWVIVPTDRLAAYIKAHSPESAERILPFDQFLYRLTHLSSEDLLDSLSWKLILSQILGQKSYRHLGLHHLHELSQLFSMVEESFEPYHVFSQLKKQLEDKVFRSIVQENTVSQRLDEIEDLFFTFQSVLSQGGYETRIQFQKKQLSHERYQPFWKNLIFAGLTTVKPSYVSFLQKLAQTQHVFFWFPHPPKILKGFSPMEDLILALGGPSSFIEEKKEDQNIANIYESKNFYEEVQTAFRLVQESLLQGYETHQIAILVTQESIYVPFLRMALKTHPHLEVNMACGCPLTESQWGYWLFLTINILSAWQPSLEDLGPWASHPFSRIGQGDFDQKQELADIPYHKTLEQIKRSCQSEDMIKDLDKISHILDFWKELKQEKQSLEIWSQHLSSFLDLFGFFQPQEKDLEKRTQEALSNVLKTMVKLSQKSAKVSFNDFLKILKDLLSEEDIRNVGFPLKGIQIVTLSESRCIPFDHVIVLGCSEGLFPRGMPKDRLVDDFMKELVGLPTWSYVESLEENTFQLLFLGAKKLDFLYTESHVRSRFLEKLLIEKKATFFSKEKSSLNIFQFKTENKEGISGYLDELSFMNASDLKDLLECPYRFLIKRKGRDLIPKLKPFRGFEEQAKKEEGIFLHQVVECFFSGFVGKKKVLDPLSSKIQTDKPLANVFLDRLTSISDVLTKESQKFSPLDVHLHHEGWPKLARFFSEFYSQTASNEWTSWTKAHFEEKAFGFDRTVKVMLTSQIGQNAQIHIQGVIDQVSFFGSSYVLLDYKRKTMSEASVQIIFYAIALYAMGLASPHQGILGHWSFLDGQWKTNYVGKDVCWPQAPLFVERVKTKAKDAQDGVSTLLQKWASVHFDILEKGFYEANPGDYCQYCSFGSVCRVKV